MSAESSRRHYWVLLCYQLIVYNYGYSYQWQLPMYNKTLRLALTLIISITLSGCIFTPVANQHQPYSNNCDLKTQKLTISEAKRQHIVNCRIMSNESDLLGCIVIEGILLPATSFIVSGSIVLINNSIHWMEYKGKCDNTSKQKSSVQDTIT